MCWEEGGEEGDGWRKRGGEGGKRRKLSLRCPSCSGGRWGASSVIFSKEGSGRGRENPKNERLGLCLVETS